MVGELPPELLRRLERDGLRPLGVVRTEVHVHERPRVLLGGLGAEAIHVVVRPVDGHHRGTVHGRRRDLRRLQIGGDEYHRPQAGVRGVRGDGVRQVAGGGARHGVEPELTGLGERHRHHAILERVRGIPGLVLHVEVGEAELGAESLGSAERAEPVTEVNGFVPTGGEEGLVAPERPWTGLDDGPHVGRPDRLQVVPGFERPEAVVARGTRLGLVGRTAFPTREPDQVLRHHALLRRLQTRRGPPRSRASHPDPPHLSPYGVGIGTPHPRPGLPRLPWACPSTALDEATTGVVQATGRSTYSIDRRGYRMRGVPVNGGFCGGLSRKALGYRVSGGNRGGST